MISENCIFWRIIQKKMGESNGWMLKRSKTGPVYFKLKETFFLGGWGGGGGVILHTHIYTFSWGFGSDAPCKWIILCFAGRCCNITHTHIHFHGDLGQRKNHLKTKSKWTFQSQAPLVVKIEGKKHGKVPQFYSSFYRVSHRCCKHEGRLLKIWWGGRGGGLSQYMEGAWGDLKCCRKIPVKEFIW